jgi:hypothetical protein
MGTGRLRGVRRQGTANPFPFQGVGNVNAPGGEDNT